jgi:hypothetical protein
MPRHAYVTGMRLQQIRVFIYALVYTPDTSARATLFTHATLSLRAHTHTDTLSEKLAAYLPSTSWKSDSSAGTHAVTSPSAVRNRTCSWTCVRVKRDLEYLKRKQSLQERACCLARSCIHTHTHTHTHYLAGYTGLLPFTPHMVRRTRCPIHSWPSRRHCRSCCSSVAACCTSAAASAEETRRGTLASGAAASDGPLPAMPEDTTLLLESGRRGRYRFS